MKDNWNHWWHVIRIARWNRRLCIRCQIVERREKNINMMAAEYCCKLLLIMNESFQGVIILIIKERYFSVMISLNFSIIKLNVRWCWNIINEKFTWSSLTSRGASDVSCPILFRIEVIVDCMIRNFFFTWET